MSDLPEIFIQRLKEIIPSAHFQDVLAAFGLPKIYSIRVNFLKTSVPEVQAFLKDNGFSFQPVGWCPEAFIISDGGTKQNILDPWFKRGWIYKQSLSSLFVPVVLNPMPGEVILDMCAAPGSKTTQIAAKMNNQGRVIAVEMVRDRFYKLKSVVELLEASCVDIVCMDAQRYESRVGLFDRILLDAPCSSEGRFNIHEKKSYAYWRPGKVKEMQEKQKGLALTAARMLKMGGTMVYSTCTFAPEENEGVIDWLLKKMDGQLDVVAIDASSIQQYPAIEQWGKKTYNPQVKKCFRVLPNGVMEGFFVTKLVKIR